MKLNAGYPVVYSKYTQTTLTPKRNRLLNFMLKIRTKIIELTCK